MLVTIKSRNMILDEELTEHARQSVSRLDRYVSGLRRAEVEFSREKAHEATGRARVELNLVGDHLLLRGEQEAADPRVAVDTLVDATRRRLERAKRLAISRRRRSPSAADLTAEGGK